MQEEIPRLTYENAEPWIRSGDLLSFQPRCVWWRPWSWMPWIIALTNPGHICHTAMACWWGKNLLAVQMTSSPQRIVLLSELVRKWPGKITVSTPNGRIDKSAAVDTMVRITERPYGWVRIVLLGLAHTFTGGLLYPNVPDDQYQDTKWPPVCSEAYSRACRINGYRVSDRPDCRTEPHHLYESHRLTKCFVLV
jgi:hypothetical protein